MRPGRTASMSSRGRLVVRSRDKLGMNPARGCTRWGCRVKPVLGADIERVWPAWRSVAEPGLWRAADEAGAGCAGIGVLGHLAWGGGLYGHLGGLAVVPGLAAAIGGIDLHQAGDGLVEVGAGGGSGGFGQGGQPEGDQIGEHGGHDLGRGALGEGLAHGEAAAVDFGAVGWQGHGAQFPFVSVYTVVPPYPKKRLLLPTLWILTKHPPSTRPGIALSGRGVGPA